MICGEEEGRDVRRTGARRAGEEAGAVADGRVAGRDSSRSGEDVMEGKEPSP